MEREVMLIVYNGWECEIASDEIYFPVRDKTGAVRGTIERPHRGHKGWMSYDIHGKATRSWSYPGPKTALIGLRGKR